MLLGFIAMARQIIFVFNRHVENVRSQGFSREVKPTLPMLILRC